MPLNLRLIVHTILEDYALPWHGTHGVAHWARVLENGLRLAEMTGADLEIIQLFALLHDSKRVNECTDPDHGRRAAEFAKELQCRVFDLCDRAFGLKWADGRACFGVVPELVMDDWRIDVNSRR